MKQKNSESKAENNFAATKFRPVCITEDIKLGRFTTSEQAARDKASQHEVDFPEHVTDVEVKE